MKTNIVNIDEIISNNGENYLYNLLSNYWSNNIKYKIVGHNYCTSCGDLSKIKDINTESTAGEYLDYICGKCFFYND
jgi:hypothetical protein